MSSLIKRVVSSRLGLVALVLGPLLALIASAGMSAHAESTRTSYLDRVAASAAAAAANTDPTEMWTMNPQWSNLPGFGEPVDNAFGTGQQYPVPSDEDAVVATVDDAGNVHYSIEYADGARLTVDVTPGDHGFFTYTEPRNLPVQALFVVLLVLALGTIVFGGTALIYNLAGPDPVAARLAREMHLGPAPRALAERWFRRSRYYRLLGGIVVLILYLGLNNGAIEVDVLALAVLCGIAFGGAIAEIHVLRTPRPRAVAADITPRRMGDYANGRDHFLMAVLAAISLVVFAAGIGRWLDPETVWWSGLVVVLFAIVLIFQRLVATRARPALGSELRAADDLLRYLASTHGFARPAIGAAFLALAFAVAQDDGGWWNFAGWGVLTLAGLLWLYLGRTSTLGRRTLDLRRS